MMPRQLATVTALLSLTIGGLAFAQAGKRHEQPVEQKPFGTHEGRPINLYTLKNANGMEVDAMNYGGIIVSIRVPDRKGQLADVVLGHEKLEGYIPNPPYLGAIVGRYANRIANGTFTLDGKTYTLPKNDGPNTLHGGPDALDQPRALGHVHAVRAPARDDGRIEHDEAGDEIRPAARREHPRPALDARLDLLRP